MKRNQKIVAGVLVLALAALFLLAGCGDPPNAPPVKAQAVDNKPPTITSVSAAPANMTLPAHTTHVKVIAADPEGGRVWVQWSCNPPDSVVFSNTTALEADVVFPTRANTYTLTATVKDSVDAQTTGSVAVTVNPKAQPKKGMISFDSYPAGAEVFLVIAGEWQPWLGGAKTPCGPDSMVAGVWRWGFRLSGYHDTTLVATIESGQNVSVHVDLIAWFGFFHVVVDPPEASNADVYLYQNLIGNAPGSWTLNARTYVVRVHKEGFQDAVDIVTIPPGGDVQRHYTLERLAPGAQETIVWVGDSFVSAKKDTAHVGSPLQLGGDVVVYLGYGQGPEDLPQLAEICQIELVGEDGRSIWSSIIPDQGDGVVRMRIFENLPRGLYRLIIHWRGSSPPVNSVHCYVVMYRP